MAFQFDLRRCSLVPYAITYALSLIFFPGIPLFFSSPFLVASLYRLNLNRYLWCGLAAGIFLDLLSSNSPIGFHGAAFLLACIGLNSLKPRFFSDSLSTLPIMTFFGSLFQLLSMLLLSPFFGISTPLSLSWVFTDLLCMPLIDALSAFCFFILIPMLFLSRSKRSQDYFMKDSP